MRRIADHKSVEGLIHTAIKKPVLKTPAFLFGRARSAVQEMLDEVPQAVLKCDRAMRGSAQCDRAQQGSA